MKPVIAAFLFLCIGCNQQDVTTLTAIAQKLGERADNLTPRDPALLRTWDVMSSGASVEARVRRRLLYDALLQPVFIEVTGAGEGKVTLRGQVTLAAQKSQAVELARGTVGVTNVVDELEIVAQ